ncbi:hypothetical protein ACIQYX_24625 [Bacillus toyonensis]|uniref:hypothetical protein n=1 Tax=Bacillus toyonensis TaxID=155322 RepID=UPI00381919FD
MPKLNRMLKVRDPFVMNEDCVNQSVSLFLKSKGFSAKFLIGGAKGIDVEGIKNGWRILIEPKGSHGNNHDNNTVFQTKQIRTPARLYQFLFPILLHKGLTS